MKRKKIISSILIGLLLYLSLSSHLFALEQADIKLPSLDSKEPDRTAVLQPVPGSGDTENLFFLQEDLVIQGVTNRQDYYFELTPSRKIQKGSYIQLIFGHSPTLLPLKSTITVFLDDIPLKSEFLNEKNLSNATWKLDFPSTDLKTGFHKVSILTHMEATSNLCEDQNNAANWSMIHKESVIHLNLKKNYDAFDLAWYPSPFLEKGSVTPLKTAFIMADAPTEGQIKALTQLSAFFSKLASSSLLQFKVVKESDLTDETLKSYQQIWIGNKDQWKSHGNTQVKEMEKKRAVWPEGSVFIQASAFEPAHSAMMITGNDAHLANAINVLTDKALYSQLSGDMLDLSQVPLAAPGARSNDSARAANTVTLDDMGYPDLIIESPLVGAARINYSIPPEWDVYKGAQLKLQFKHTKTLNYTQSLMTVKVNGMPLSSQYLNEETSELGSVEVSIPQELLKNGQINIDIGFQFSSSKESCTGNSQIGNWAVISKDSFLSFSYRPNRVVQFDNLPYPFVQRNIWNNAAFVTDDKPSSDTLSLLASVAGLIGKNAASSTSFDVFTSSAAETAIKDKNIVYVGSAAGLPPTINQSNVIPIKFENGSFVSTTPQIEIMKGQAGQAGLIQMFESPYNNSRYVMAVTGMDDQALNRINKLQSIQLERNKMQGQVILVDALNRIHTFRTIQKKEEDSLLDRTMKALAPNNKSIKSRVILIVCSVVVLFALACVFWFVRKRRKINKGDR